MYWRVDFRLRALVGRVKGGLTTLSTAQIFNVKASEIQTQKKRFKIEYSWNIFGVQQWECSVVTLLLYILQFTLRVPLIKWSFLCFPVEIQKCMATISRLTTGSPYTIITPTTSFTFNVQWMSIFSEMQASEGFLIIKSQNNLFICFSKVGRIMGV